MSNINKLDEAEKIIDWTFRNLYNSRKQSFYFEKRKYFVNKNIYHRWNQAWMYLALSCDINKEYKNDCIDNMRYLIDDAAKILA